MCSVQLISCHLSTRPVSQLNKLFTTFCEMKQKKIIMWQRFGDGDFFFGIIVYLLVHKDQIYNNNDTNDNTIFFIIIIIF